jgi:hypothetical protein
MRVCAAPSTPARCSTWWRTRWRPAHAVQVECRRMGGGFGGKESQSAVFACVAAMAAARLQRPGQAARGPRRRLSHHRPPALFHYALQAAYDANGRILAAEVDMVSRAGHSADLSGPVMTRALCHFDNCLLAAAPGPARLLGQDPHAEQHRVPRLRRAAGRHRRGTAPRLGGAAAGPGPAGGAPRQLLRQGPVQRHSVRPGGGRQHHPRTGGPTGCQQRLRSTPRRHRRIQCRQPGAEEGPGAHAAEVRHLASTWCTSTRPVRWCTCTPTAACS